METDVQPQVGDDLTLEDICALHGLTLLQPGAELIFQDRVLVLAVDQPASARFRSRDSLEFTLAASSREAMHLIDNETEWIEVFARKALSNAFTYCGRATLSSHGGELGGKAATFTFAFADPLPTDVATRFDLKAPDAPMLGPALCHALFEHGLMNFDVAWSLFTSWYGTARNTEQLEASPRVLEYHRLRAAIAATERHHMWLCQEALWQPDGEDPRYTLFQAEEQWVTRWAVATDPRQGDAVFCPPDMMPVGRTPVWTCQAQSLGEFAVQSLLCFGAYGGGVGISGWLHPERELGERLLSCFEPLPLLDWTWPADRVRFLGSEYGFAIDAGTESGREIALWLPDDEALSALVDRVGPLEAFEATYW